MKGCFFVLVIGTIVGFICYWAFWVILAVNVTQEAVSAYEKPDTTITIHNGKPDTVIIKKQSTSIFK